ncbi:hypothetical protein MCP1_640003 [Candidatus Terasakiella magnetica]|nr:hypothetical protein MCP1_640003 [Candidatus Terasakiella magnetica]
MLASTRWALALNLERKGRAASRNSLWSSASNIRMTYLLIIPTYFKIANHHGKDMGWKQKITPYRKIVFNKYQHLVDDAYGFNAIT